MDGDDPNRETPDGAIDRLGRPRRREVEEGVGVCVDLSAIGRFGCGMVVSYVACAMRTMCATLRMAHATSARGGVASDVSATRHLHRGRALSYAAADNESARRSTMRDSAQNGRRLLGRYVAGRHLAERGRSGFVECAAQYAQYFHVDVEKHDAGAIRRATHHHCR